MASVVLATMAIYSCGEGTDSIGQSVTNTDERLEIGNPTEFPVETQSYTLYNNNYCLMTLFIFRAIT